MVFGEQEDLEDESYLLTIEEETPYYLFKTFDALVQHIREIPGSYYERKHDLPKRCVYGKLWGESFGTITYVTDDGRTALMWGFKLGGSGWAYVYPPDDMLQYFYIHAREHISAVLENNKKKYKVDYMNEQTNETKPINWGDFQNTFLRVEPGTTIDVTLTNWRQGEKTFNPGEPRTALIFDVVVVGDVEYKDPLEWSTTSAALAHEFKPLIARAEQAGRKSLRVRMKRGTDKRYMVVELG